MKLNKVWTGGLFCMIAGWVGVAYGAPLWVEDFNDPGLTNGNWIVSVSDSEDPPGMAVVTNGRCSLVRTVSTNGVNGHIYIHRSMSNIPEYKTTLCENDKTVSWGIRIIDINFSPGSSYSTSFQYAYVLAASSSNFMTEGSGYFIGTDGEDNVDFLYLGRYSSGLQDGAVEPVISTEFPLTRNTYDSASIRVDFDPVSSVWSLYADRNSGMEPSGLTNLTGTVRADSAYTDVPLPHLGVMYNFRYWSPTYMYSLDVDSLSLHTSSQRDLSRIPGADGGGVVYDYFIDFIETRVSDYVDFLNQTQFSEGLIVQGGRVKNAGGTLYCLTTDAAPSAYIAYNSGLPLAERFSAAENKSDHPMVFVSWFGAAAYCNWKSQSAGLSPAYDPAGGWVATTNRGYRLPSGAEWHKAAAWQPDFGIHALYGTASNILHQTEANFLHSGDAFETNEIRTAPVAGYPGASEYALRDASGNVWEWCDDFLDAGQTNALTDPRVVRGGGWGNLLRDVTAEVRGGHSPEQMNDSTGFRMVIPVK